MLNGIPITYEVMMFKYSHWLKVVKLYHDFATYFIAPNFKIHIYILKRQD